MRAKANKCQLVLLNPSVWGVTGKPVFIASATGHGRKQTKPLVTRCPSPSHTLQRTSREKRLIFQHAIMCQEVKDESNGEGELLSKCFCLILFFWTAKQQQNQFSDNLFLFVMCSNSLCSCQHLRHHRVSRLTFHWTRQDGETQLVH